MLGLPKGNLLEAELALVAPDYESVEDDYVDFFEAATGGDETDSAAIVAEPPVLPAEEAAPVDAAVKEAAPVSADEEAAPVGAAAHAAEPVNPPPLPPRRDKVGIPPVIPAKPLSQSLSQRFEKPSRELELDPLKVKMSKSQNLSRSLKLMSKEIPLASKSDDERNQTKPKLPDVTRKLPARARKAPEKLNL